MGRAEQAFWKRRFSTIKGIRAVGRRDLSAENNRLQYAEAAALFRKMVANDLPVGQRRSALDLGYGMGHYAALCRSLGFKSYVGLDFAGRKPPELGKEFVFRHQDIGQSFDLGRKFSLVMAIDVIYHVLCDEEFDVAIENMRRHASGVIYVTGLFQDLTIAHCRHREPGRFARLGRLVDIQPWRDNKIARFVAT